MTRKKVRLKKVVDKMIEEFPVGYEFTTHTLQSQIDLEEATPMSVAQAIWKNPKIVNVGKPSNPAVWRKIE